MSMEFLNSLSILGQFVLSCYHTQNIHHVFLLHPQKEIRVYVLHDMNATRQIVSDISYTDVCSFCDTQESTLSEKKSGVSA